MAPSSATSVPGVEPHLLYPMKTWKDKAAFDETARKLVRMFQENFVKYEQHVDPDLRSAAPEVRIAAEYVSRHSAEPR
jgi:phosphoenolpyruvate carboxykinase (ATP)